MRKVQHGELFSIVILLFVMIGIMLSPETVQAVEMNETIQSSNTTGTQSGSAAGAENITKTITKQNTDVSMETSCGIDGFAVYDRPAVVTLTVSYNKDFTGSIRMIPVMDTGQTVVAYGEDISLAKGEAKTFSFTPASIGNNGKIKIELLDENEKVIYSETDTVSLNSIGDIAMMGILSDDYSALNYFDGVPVDFNGAQTVINTLELTTDSFPDSKEALSVLNYILIDNYDTANLSDEQYTALKDWVNGGGVLFLSLGANYQNVLHKFSDEFLTGTLGNLEKKKLTWVSEEWEELTLENVDSMEFVLDGGDFSSDTFCKKTSGLGAVVVFSYDWGMEPITSYKNKKEVAEFLIKELSMAGAAGVVNNVNVDYTTGAETAKVMNDAPKPSAVLYSLILIAYIILVGPVLYLVLKKVKHREKIWMAIPVVALVFTGIIYGTGFLYRVGKPIIDTFSVISVENEGKVEKVYMNITCPKAKQYRFKLNEDYKDLSYGTDYYYYNLFDTGTSKNSFDFMLKKKNDGMELLANSDSIFKDIQLTVNRTGENDLGNLDTDLHFYTDGFDGTITNNTIYDLKNIVVNFENHYYLAGDLKKGETVAIDKTKLVEARNYGTFDTIYSSNKKLYSDKNVYKSYQIDTFMENSYVNISAYNQGCIWAEIGTYKPKIVDDQYGKIYGEGVLFTAFTGDYGDVTGAYYPDINKAAVTTDGDFDSSDRMMYSNLVTVAYSFDDCKNITELTNQSYGKTPENYYAPNYADVYAYNVVSGEYEQIFTDSDTISGEELKKYVVNNSLSLRYMSGAQSNVFMPKITAKGEN